MGPVGIGRLAHQHRSKTIGKGILRGGANADVCLHAGNDDPFDLLFGEEEGEIGGEKCGEAALEDQRFVEALGRKSSKNSASSAPSK